MVFSREDLRNQLKRREIAPVYVLFGAETHLRDVAAKTIADFSFADGDLRDFNETVFSLNSDGNLKAALSAAEFSYNFADNAVPRWLVRETCWNRYSRDFDSFVGPRRIPSCESIDINGECPNGTFAVTRRQQY